MMSDFLVIYMVTQEESLFSKILLKCAFLQGLYVSWSWSKHLMKVCYNIVIMTITNDKFDYNVIIIISIIYQAKYYIWNFI